MPDLVVTEPGQDQAPFAVGPGPGYQPTDGEREWCDRVNALLATLCKVGGDPDRPVRPDVIGERDTFVKRLRASADRICGTDQSPRAGAVRDGLRTSYLDEGVYTDRVARLNEQPFSVWGMKAPASDRIVDIQIDTYDVDLPSDKQQFKVQLDQAVTVVKTVFADGDGVAPAVPDDPSRWARAWAWLMNFALPPQTMIDQLRLDEYLRALLGIAQVGLTGRNTSQTPFAVLALNGFKTEFVSREAGRVKNRYVRRLGLHALLAFGVAAACYVVTLLLLPHAWIAYRFRNFFVLAAGAAIGTWLSFSIRRQNLAFEDLATLEDDRLNPGVRVLFMVALTTVVGLILWTGMVTVVIGDFRTDFRLTGSYAALIGCLCGIAERSLTGAVSRRATELVGGIGGTLKPVD